MQSAQKRSSSRMGLNLALLSPSGVIPSLPDQSSHSPCGVRLRCSYSFTEGACNGRQEERSVLRPGVLYREMASPRVQLLEVQLAEQ